MRLKTLGALILFGAVVLPVAFVRADYEDEHPGQFYWSQNSGSGGSSGSGKTEEATESSSETSERSRRSRRTIAPAEGNGTFLNSFIQNLQKSGQSQSAAESTPAPILPNTSAPRVLIEQVMEAAQSNVLPSVVIPTSTPPRESEPEPIETAQQPAPEPAPNTPAPEPETRATSTQSGQPQLVDFFGEAIGSYIKQVTNVQPSRRQTRDTKPETEKPVATSTEGAQSAAPAQKPLEISVVIKAQASTSAERRENGRRDERVAKSLDQIGQAIHNITTSKKSVERKVENIVAERVQETVRTAVDALPPASTSSPTVAFSEKDREQLVEKIRSKAEEKGRDITAEISDTITSPPSGRYIPGQVDPVLKSSLVEIQEIVLAETGVAVAVAPGERAVVEDVAEIEENARQIEEQRRVLESRAGLELYRDTDNDGVSNYDETHIYETDPNNAYTAGSALTDGERILLGFDAHSPAPALVPVESPKVAGQETKAMFEITEISLVPMEALVAVATPALTGSAQPPEAAAPLPSVEKAVQIKGKALPNSFVTLYIYSNPIVVTVKADESGLWTYTLDTALEDGEHEIYVASVNNSGKILAKSAPIPFVKTAEALEFEPLTIQEVTKVSPLDTLREHFLVTGGVLLALFALIALVAVGMRRDAAAV